jgi:hypothetical protein
MQQKTAKIFNKEMTIEEVEDLAAEMLIEIFWDQIQSRKGKDEN